MMLLPMASVRVVASPSSETPVQHVEARDWIQEVVTVALDESSRSNNPPSPTPDIESLEAHRVALAEYRELRGARPENAAEWRSVAFKLLRTGEPALSADAFEREYEINRCPGALYNMGCALAIGGQPERALEMLERAEKAGMPVSERALHDPDLASIRSRISERQSVSVGGASMTAPSTRR